jgi:hypothetical protein
MKKVDSYAMHEVWEWKDKAYKEVEHLPINKAIRKRLEDSIKSVKKANINTSYPDAKKSR